MGEVSEKLAYFARHKDEYDAVFVGSSRVYRQIAPGVFDRQVAASTGRAMRSFNLGAPSMFLPESLYVIDRILAQRPRAAALDVHRTRQPPARAVRNTPDSCGGRRCTGTACARRRW